MKTPQDAAQSLYKLADDLEANPSRSGLADGLQTVLATLDPVVASKKYNVLVSQQSGNGFTALITWTAMTLSDEPMTPHELMSALGNQIAGVTAIIKQLLTAPDFAPYSPTFDVDRIEALQVMAEKTGIGVNASAVIYFSDDISSEDAKSLWKAATKGISTVQFDYEPWR